VIAIFQQPSGKLAANFGLFVDDWKYANDEPLSISDRQLGTLLI